MCERPIVFQCVFFIHRQSLHRGHESSIILGQHFFSSAQFFLLFYFAGSIRNDDLDASERYWSDLWPAGFTGVSQKPPGEPVDAVKRSPFVVSSSMGCLKSVMSLKVQRKRTTLSFSFLMGATCMYSHIGVPAAGERVTVRSRWGHRRPPQHQTGGSAWTLHPSGTHYSLCRAAPRRTGTRSYRTFSGFCPSSSCRSGHRTWSCTNRPAGSQQWFTERLFIHCCSVSTFLQSFSLNKVAAMLLFWRMNISTWAFLWVALLARAAAVHDVSSVEAGQLAEAIVAVNNRPLYDLRVPQQEASFCRKTIGQPWLNSALLMK